MSIGITASEYQELRRRVHDVIWEVVDPLCEQIESDEAIPHDRIWPALAEAGALGLLLPREHGGSGLSVRQYLPLIAEFAKSHGGVRAAVHVHNSFAHALSEIGNEEQQAQLLPGLATGEYSLAFALTEPDHGTGADLGTTAEREGDEYVLRGRKHLITNSDFASHFLVMAKTAEHEVSMLLVPRDTDNFSAEPLPETMGCKGGEHGQLTFTGVRVPASALVGREGEGQDLLEQALEISRLFVAASSWGTAERALELSVARAKERTTFGKPIGERQAVQRYLAEMAVDVHALRTVLLDAADKYDTGLRIPAEASMCKQLGMDVVGRVTDRALLVFGGIGYTRRHPIERLYRDARLNWLEEGTPTIQYLVIARELLTGYRFRDGWDDAAGA